MLHGFGSKAAAKTLVRTRSTNIMGPKSMFAVGTRRWTGGSTKSERNELGLLQRNSVEYLASSGPRRFDKRLREALRIKDADTRAHFCCEKLTAFVNFRTCSFLGHVLRMNEGWASDCFHGQPAYEDLVNSEPLALQRLVAGISVWCGDKTHGRRDWASNIELYNAFMSGEPDERTTIGATALMPLHPYQINILASRKTKFTMVLQEKRARESLGDFATGNHTMIDELKTALCEKRGASSPELNTLDTWRDSAGNFNDDDLQCDEAAYHTGATNEIYCCHCKKAFQGTDIRFNTVTVDPPRWGYNINEAPTILTPRQACRRRAKDLALRVPFITPECRPVYGLRKLWAHERACEANPHRIHPPGLDPPGNPIELTDMGTFQILQAEQISFKQEI